MSELSFFRVAGAELAPEPMACSLWSDDQMHGVALSGALARALEQAQAAAGRTDLRPARYTVDLFRPASMSPCSTSATVVREGRRLCLIDAKLEQAGVVVARATAVFLKPSASPEGKVWSPDPVLDPPPLSLAPVSR